ncbi:TetR/AcrR family transcriptional regulator [Photobacterium halotolerans]|uniref:TetR family transcriptional regulator n=1 Tax=Photobacterium halotolerans TaxID=265726 RepID=A0A0F5VBE2_9GAMM|nr:TetR/AcrR family transcriptional regulator [Photobacterium halotolerans]KKC99443.1 TetR family transcriptional regulator [Photobacterium halotolerans]
MNNSDSILSKNISKNDSLKPNHRRGRPVGDRESKRAELLTAAIAVTAEEGYAGASLRKVAKRMGGTTGTVTYYYKNKEEMLAAVAEELFNRIDALLALDEKEVSIKHLLHKWLNWINSSESDLWLAMIQLLAHARHEAAFANILYRRYATLKATFIKMAEEGQKAGNIRKDIPAEIIASQLVAMCDGWMISQPIELKNFTDEQLNLQLDSVMRLISPPSK